MQLNLIDLGIALVVLYFVVAGWRRGFLTGVADLGGIAFAFLFAIKLYPQASDLLVRAVDLPRILTNFISLITLFVLGELLFSLIASPFLGFAYRRLLVGPLRLADNLGGTLPGLAKGLLLTAMMVAFFAMFPLSADLRDQVRSSTLGGWLSDAAGTAAPRVEALLGGSLHDSALFVTQPSEAEAPRKMNFPAGMALRVDTKAEQRMLEMVNEERVKAGLRPLVADERLRTVAREKSEDMFRQGYFAHESPNGDTPADRLRAARIPFLMMGENLAYAPDVTVAHIGLMNSPGHRANILSPNFGRVGIGVVDGGIHGEMFSQEFAN